MSIPASASTATSVVWLRDDLRLDDQPALAGAASDGLPVVALFVLDEAADRRAPGGAQRWWLGESLKRLASALDARSVRLVLARGDAAVVVPDMLARLGARSVHWNRRYEPAARALDGALKAQLSADGIRVASHNGHLLGEPWTIANKAGEPFRVFTPFWKALRLACTDLARPLPTPELIPSPPLDAGLSLDALGLAPKPDWAAGLAATFTPGEDGAARRLEAFLAGGLARYADGRDLPGGGATSLLSPHLRFGEISVRQVWHAVHAAVAAGMAGERDAEKFLSEIAWRDFAYHLLYHLPDIARHNMQPRFDAFPWADSSSPEARRLLEAWKRGETGYPIVDAGMRELWQTGTMHNRVRMVTASFLVKHLLLDWRLGEAWFWDTLCDGDVASNPASWQWVAGSGADAAPYFRVFNPVAQGERFDAAGAYVRRFVPEVAPLPDHLLHRPWQAGGVAGFRPGRDYPHPVVDHETARDRALAAFSTLKTRAAA